MSTIGKKVSILGGTGKMGRWFANFLKRKGYDVVISGRNPAKAKSVALELGVGFASTDKEAVAEADIVIVATPIDIAPVTIREVSRHLKHGAVLFDIASIKRDVVKALEEAKVYGIHVLSLHPMFGSGIKSLRGKNMIIVPVGREPPITDAVSKLFTEEGAQVYIAESAEIHDRMIALTLSLPHFINLVFGRVLSSLGVNVNEVKKYGGTTFLLQLLIAESVYQQDPDMYALIQTENRAFHDLLERILENTDELKKLVVAKDREGFVKFFNKSTKYFAEDEMSVRVGEKFNSAVECLA
jgi:prephenate dehydrogenase